MNKFQAGYVKFVNNIFGGWFETYFKEAIALQGTDELDENKYRRLTAKKRDLKPMQFKQIMDGAFYLWQRNPMARRMIEIILDFTVGNDLDVNCRIMKKTKDGPQDMNRPEPQELWKKFCEDPVNAVYDDIETFLQDFLIFGELLMPMAVNEANKMPRFGFIDVGEIEKVVRDESGRRIASVFVKSENEAKLREVKILNKDAGEWEGEALYFQYSRTLTKSRGQSFLTELLDWIDALDQFQFNVLEGSALRNAFFYDMTMKGATKEELKQVDVSSPKPGSVRVHNEAVEWDVVSPELNATDTSESMRQFKNMILAGKGFPEHWFADGGNTNLATAEKMAQPVLQMLKRQQKQIKYILKTLATYAIEVQAQGVLNLGKDEYLDIEVVTVDLERSDAAALGAAFTAIVGALSTATDKGWVSDDKAKQVIDTIISRYGVPPDEETVESIMEKNKSNRDATDQNEVDDLYVKTGNNNGDTKKKKQLAEQYA